MPAPFFHSSGLAGVYDRTPDKPNWTRVLFREDRVAQAAEMMEMQSIGEARTRRVADRLMSDGARVDGAEIIVDAEAGTVTLTAGHVYARGDVREVAEATLTGVPMTGDVLIGVRIVSTVQTEEQDSDMLGLHPGSDAEGEPGAGRQIETAQWGRSGDGGSGDLYQVFLLKDGVPLDQTVPGELAAVTQAIATYDRDANGSYVVRGCGVTALGRIAGAQHFSIGEGVANIFGFKRSRTYSLRHAEPEEWDTAEVDAEPKTFTDGGTGTAVLTLNRGPLAVMGTAIITKQKTVTVTKGTANGLDLLPDSSISSIVSVVQGATTYVAGTSYNLNADRVDWAPGGAEPATGSTYNVTYRYLDAVTPDATTDDTVTLSGGVTGGAVFLSYTWKMPRVDLLCLDQAGYPVYVRGISTVVAPRAPAQPSALLALAQVHNDWRGTPRVVNTDIRSIPYEEMWVYFRRLYDALDLIALERLKSDIDNREPVAKKGVFVDPWQDATYQDAGETQTAAIFNGEMRLAVIPTVFNIGPATPQMLAFTEEVVIRQELFTACMKINPYQNFDPMPFDLALNPAVDFWTTFATEWRSAVTQSMTGAVSGTTVTDQLLGTTTAALPNLRPITVQFTITGFGAGEILTSLTFDGLNVTPPAIAANASGVATGSFVIPTGIPAGTKQVIATGASGRQAMATFVGQGRVETTIMRQVTTITEAPPPPAPPPMSLNRFLRQIIDPLAQTFTLVAPRFIAGVDIRVCAVGNQFKPIRVEIHGVENGIPTQEILAQRTLSMVGVTAGQWLQARFPLPVWLANDREYCVMVKTDDADHALSIARLGDFDATAQRYVSGQPYSVGVLLSSSNAQTWTPHQNEDLTFRLIAAKFAPVTRTVSLGTVAVTDMSDAIIKAGVECPTGDASVVFEVVRASGDVIRLLPDQPWQLDAYVTETMTLRAVLSGTEQVSPILYPFGQFIAGRIEGTGVYITRAFDMGSSIRMSAFVKSRLPAGSTLAVAIDAADDNWTAVTQHAAVTLDEGWVEREYRRAPYTATVGRLRLTLTGGPAARPVLTDMRAVSI